MKRRTFLQGVAAGSAAVSVSGGAVASGTGTAERAAPVVVWPLFDPLGAGSEVGLGWSLARLSDVRRGALVLTLRHEDGREAEVHICRRGREGRGIAHTPKLDLLLMNDGDGDQPTDESVGRVIKTLARLIAKNERRAPAGLLAHPQRISAHGPRGILAAPSTVETSGKRQVESR